MLRLCKQERSKYEFSTLDKEQETIGLYYLFIDGDTKELTETQALTFEAMIDNEIF